KRAYCLKIQPATGSFARNLIYSTKPLERRRTTYPEDVFVFQSHSNRVKNRASPVTVIAFNTAIRKVSKVTTGELASSKNARKVVFWRVP
ncbi:hypothetical protein ACP6DW_33180, partial [Klebsiella pneumoniae subsp. pneumoniae]